MAVGGNRGAPEMQGRLKKFDSGERPTVFGADQARDAAGEFIVGVEIGEDELLRLDHGRRDREETTVGADVDCLRRLLEGLIVETAVEKDAHRGLYAAPSTLLHAHRRMRIRSAGGAMKPSPDEF